MSQAVAAGLGAVVPDDLVPLGYIVSAHGVHGLVKLQPHSAQAEALLAARAWWLQPQSPGTPSAARPPARRVNVLTCHRHGATLVAKLDGISDRDQAQALKGSVASLPRSAFPPPAEDEFYWVDLIGCFLYGEADDQRPTLIGQVTDVTDNGAHGVLSVARMTEAETQSPAPMLDARGRTIECLVPFVSAHIRHVDLSARRIDSNWPSDF